jgi:hypothetical protein
MLGGLALRARARSFRVIERSTTDWLARSVGNSRCRLRPAKALGMEFVNPLPSGAMFRELSRAPRPPLLAGMGCSQSDTVADQASSSTNWRASSTARSSSWVR